MESSRGDCRHKAPSNQSVDVSGVSREIAGDFSGSGLCFDMENPYADFPEAAQVVVDWGNPRYMCTYIYEETHSKYLRFEGKNPAMTWHCSAGEEQSQLAFDNVILQYVDYAWLDGNAWLPDAQLEGEGRVVVFTCGRRIEGRWYFDGSTHFVDESGAEIHLAPGKTYVAHLPEENSEFP